MVKSEEENNELVAAASRTLGSPYLDRNFENVNQVGFTDLFSIWSPALFNFKCHLFKGVLMLNI